ncbi:hypothetical protein Vretimale_11189 [Volvox reticuliferus]|uniref:SCP domain-containing protein n=2 Tax=Volvox reticuliferus TaxID=1737510 RepID=A0A8J4GHJ6_9CHLO|nr:hypothetical protein Vretimale_11189 [Volvox reticuliferus]
MRITTALSVLGMAWLLLLVPSAFGSAVQGYVPRRGLQQTWSSGSSAAFTKPSSSASAYTSASSGAVGSSVQSSGDVSQWSNYLGSDQGQQISQQQQDQVKSLLGSLADAFQGYFSGGDDGQHAQQPPSTQSGFELQQLQPAEQQQQQPSAQPQQVQQAQATSPPSSSASRGLSAYAQQCLDTHNYYRARHQSTPMLRWSSSLEADAQAWANRCVFSHADNTASGQGENIAWGYPDAKSAIDAYYSEGAGYTYGVSQPADWHSVGHFTQVIWRSSTDLGCAVATCSGGQLFHVCRYYPPGNVQGQYSGNVMPPSS